VEESDPRYFRPTEVDLLIGDATKARDQLDWRPAISFDGLVAEMVAADLELISREINQVAKIARPLKAQSRLIRNNRTS